MKTKTEKILVYIAIIVTSIFFGLFFTVIVSAGTTTLNQDMNLSIGDCWNDKQITEINELTITWIKGCDSNNNIAIVTPPETESSPLSNIDSIQEVHFCNSIEGNGDHALIVYGNNLFSDEYMIDWAYWVYDDIQTRTPYNEFAYSLYFEKNEGDCNFGDYSDIRLGIKDIGYYFGLSWFNGADINRIWFNDDLSNEKWDFLLHHEAAHIFLKSGHTNNGGILDKDGGDGEYNLEQINTIRENLNG
jgi:hypothetical protein